MLKVSLKTPFFVSPPMNTFVLVVIHLAPEVNETLTSFPDDNNLNFHLNIHLNKLNLKIKLVSH